MKNDNQKVVWLRIAVLAVIVVALASVLVMCHHDENPNPDPIPTDSDDVIVQIEDATSVYGEPLLTEFDFTFDTLKEGVVVNKEDLKEHITFEKEEGTDVGAYAINGTVDQELGLKVQIVSGEYTITKATYDLSNVAFDDQVVEFDGTSHSIEVSGILPEGVTVEYENNNQTEVGVYTVIARFKGDEKNYYPITKELKAELIIFDSDESTLPEEPKDSSTGTQPTEPTEPTTPTEPTEPTTPTETTPPHIGYDLVIQIHTLYSVYGEALKPLDFDFIVLNKKLSFTKEQLQQFIHLEKENGTDVGSYVISGTSSRTDIKVKFVTAHYFITKATYDMSKVKFTDKTVTYDGEKHSLFITGNLPEGVTVSYTGNEQSKVGRYEVIAHFMGDNTNYELIPDKIAYLTIEKQQDDDSGSNDPEDPGQTDPPVTPTDPTDPEDPTVPENPEEPGPSNPTDPTTPTDPTDPTVPENPEEPGPSNPTDPVTPTDPTVPTNPEEPGPSNPTDPVTPTDPTVPTNPDEPGPTNPTDPTTPTDPTVPTNPEDPTPSNPETPVTPTDPGLPTTPTDPTPSNPETPVTPTDPGLPTTPTDPTPSNPETPVTPSDPGLPTTPADPTPSNPETPVTPSDPGVPTTPSEAGPSNPDTPVIPSDPKPEKAKVTVLDMAALVPVVPDAPEEDEKATAEELQRNGLQQDDQ